MADAVISGKFNGEKKEEAVKSIGYMRLIWLRFRRHKVAYISLYVLAIYFLMAVLSEFFIPNDPFKAHKLMDYVSPRQVHFIHQGKYIGPHIYSYERGRDPKTWKTIWIEDDNNPIQIKILGKGFEYKLFGFIPASRHLLASENPEYPLFLFGTGKMGKCLLSQTIYATRVSLGIALLGVVVTLVLGMMIGGVAGYFGGIIDDTVQRISELLLSVPTLPLWMGLAAAVPNTWSIEMVYIVIVLLISLVSWPWLARGIRSKLISIRKEEFILAARNYGAGDMRIIFRYLIPNFLSYIIVSFTLNIPYMILTETTLSFLGLGLRAPAVSWGVLLEEGQNFQSILLYPWLLIPGLFVMVVILALNFVGDGIRDAVDPFSK